MANCCEHTEVPPSYTDRPNKESMKLLFASRMYPPCSDAVEIPYPAEDEYSRAICRPVNWRQDSRRTIVPPDVIIVCSARLRRRAVVLGGIDMHILAVDVRMA
eukprot:scaffold436270_cov18-Prasinocladus_malaysianus.AAC.1